MTSAKYDTLCIIVQNAPNNSLNSLANRKKLAKTIATKCNLWETNVVTFVEEMKGLSFSSSEERQIFLQFAEVGF